MSTTGFRRPLAARTVLYTHTIFRKMLAKAVDDGVLAVNPSDKATPPSAKEAASPEMKTWNAEQLRSFLDHTKSHRLYALFVVYATTGLRRGEALGLKWEDIDFENSRLAVRRAVTETAGTVVVTTPKTAKSRGIALDPVTIEALKTHRTKQAAERLLKGPRWVDEGWVFAHSGRNYGKDGPAGGVLQPDSVANVQRAHRYSECRVG